MKLLRSFSIFMMAVIFLLAGLSSITIADQGAPITSEGGALDALNQQFGQGFIQNPGSGPGYQTLGGENNQPAPGDNPLTAPDTFGDGVNGTPPFGGYYGCGFAGREIHEPASRQFNDKAGRFNNPATLDAEFESLFGVRPVSATNDQPN